MKEIGLRLSHEVLMHLEKSHFIFDAVEKQNLANWLMIEESGSCEAGLIDPVLRHRDPCFSESGTSFSPATGSPGLSRPFSQRVLKPPPLAKRIPLPSRGHRSSSKNDGRNFSSR